MRRGFCDRSRPVFCTHLWVRCVTSTRVVVNEQNAKRAERAPPSGPTVQRLRENSHQQATSLLDDKNNKYKEFMLTCLTRRTGMRLSQFCLCACRTGENRRNSVKSAEALMLQIPGG